MDANVTPEPLGMGLRDDKAGLAEALAELKAAQASKDRVWQARAARQVRQLQERKR